VQPQQRGVQLRVITRGRGGLVDLRQPGVRHRPAGSRQAARLGHLPDRVVRLGDQPVVHGALVQAPQRRHQVLLRAAPAAGVAAGHEPGGPAACQQTGRVFKRCLVHGKFSPLWVSPPSRIQPPLRAGPADRFRRRCREPCRTGASADREGTPQRCPWPWKSAECQPQADVPPRPWPGRPVGWLEARGLAYPELRNPPTDQPVPRRAGRRSVRVGIRLGRGRVHERRVVARRHAIERTAGPMSNLVRAARRTGEPERPAGEQGRPRCV
jgi:hypothetical protein